MSAFHGLTVALDDIHDEDIDGLVEAIKRMRGVLAVTKHEVTLSDYTARSKVRNELWEKVADAFWPKKERDK